MNGSFDRRAEPDRIDRHLIGLFYQSVDGTPTRQTTTSFTFMLTLEEKFLWQCARSWREARLPPIGLDWDRVVTMAVKNRMGPLLQVVLEETGIEQHLPHDALRALQRDVALQQYRTQLFGRELRRFLRLAGRRRLPVVVIKGLWLSSKIYGLTHMRPGGDIDLLLHRRDVRASLNILDYEMGYGRWWRPILDDAYYARHHLHQQRCNRGRAVWFEPHWRLDHPYTFLTIDYDAMLQRSQPATLFGEPVRELSPPDLLLSLVVHLTKHALYLTSILERRDLPRLIVADGMLMYFADVAEVLQHYEQTLNWDCVVARAQEAGAGEMVGAVLRVCHRWLAAPIPQHVLKALPVKGPDALTRRLMQGMVEHLLSVHEGQRPNRLWSTLGGFQESLIFRPIRLLDLARYCLPDADYLERRYGSSSATMAIWHLLRAAGQYGRLALDTAFYSWRRKKRIQHMNPQELALCDARYDPLLDGRELPDDRPAGEKGS